MYTLNSRVLISDADNFSVDQAINPYYGDGLLDRTQAQAEHAAIHQALTDAGIEVVKTPSPTTSQDGVYTANWALVRGDTAVLARLPDVRKSEEDNAEQVLRSLGKTVVRVPNGYKFSGQGDALICGPYVFCGSVYRSDVEAQAFAAETLGLERIQLQTIPSRDAKGEPVTNAVSGWPDSFFYDLDLALAVLRAPTENEKGLIAYCPDAFMPESQAILEAFDGVDKMTISFEEAKVAFAANLVSSGSSVVMSAHAPAFKAELEARGFTVITPEVQELAKGGGYIRCTSLSLD